MSKRKLDKVTITITGDQEKDVEFLTLFVSSVLSQLHANVRYQLPEGIDSNCVAEFFDEKLAAIVETCDINVVSKID